MRKIDDEGQIAATPLQRANFLMRDGQWEQAAIAYMQALEARTSLRSVVAVNLDLLVKRAPSGSIDKEVVGQIKTILTSVNVGFAHAGATCRDTTVPAIALHDEPSALARVIAKGLGVEQVYVVNLARRPDRYVRVLREMTGHGLRIKRIVGVDASISDEANDALERFRARPIEERCKSSEHVAENVMRQYKTQLSVGVFGYILSQARVLRDAIANGYKRILVLDDDVFFHSAAAYRLDEICRYLPGDLKVLLLGASEYADRNSDAFREARIFGHADLYSPIAGKTCGSFAMVYDQSVYEELVGAIDEADGTFDNVILGSIYQRNFGKCVVVDPAVCIPDVGDSDIRPNARAQATHGARMNWEIERYPEYTRPLSATVLVGNLDSLRHIESMRNELGAAIFLNVFFQSIDGIRPVIPGHRFIPRDQSAEGIEAASPAGFRLTINKLRIPHSDVVLLWPNDRLLTEDATMSLFSQIMQVHNATGMREGAIDGVLYCIDAGIAPVIGRHSIVIPSYRDVNLVWPTVRSALSQDAKDFEVIVVNDNPENHQFSPQLESIALAWEREGEVEGLARRLLVIDHRRNRLGAAARNTGLLNSSGEFISFLDDDDYYESTRLSGIEAGFSDANSDLGASYCGYSGAWNGERDMERFPEGDLGDHVLALRYSKHYMCTNTITFRRSSLFRLGGFNESYARHQDLELMARFFERFRISSVADFLVKNRPNPVPETFVADIPKLCRLKLQFLADMRRELNRRGEALVAEAIDAHTRDISKRDKQMSPGAISAIRSCLETAVRTGV